MSEVPFLAGGIDDQKKVIAPVGHHQVVDDAALIVGQDGVTGSSFAQSLDVARHQRFQRRRRPGPPVVAFQARLTHVGNIEQACVFTGVEVFGDDSALIMHGHGVTGERHHLCAKFTVKRIKRRLLEVFLGSRGVLLAHGFCLNASTLFTGWLS